MHTVPKLTAAKPLQDRVLVRPDDKEEKTPGGILLPDQLQHRPRRGTVVAVGPGRYDPEGNLVPMGLKGGERVLFVAWGETEVRIGDEDLFIMKEDSVTAVITD